MLVAAGKEPFIRMDGMGYDPHGSQSTSRAYSRANISTRGSDMIASRMKTRRERLANTSKNNSFLAFNGGLQF